MSGPEEEENPLPEEDLGQEPMASPEETDDEYNDLYYEMMVASWPEEDWIYNWSMSEYELSLTEDETSSSDEESMAEEEPEPKTKTGPKPKDEPSAQDQPEPHDQHKGKHKDEPEAIFESKDESKLKDESPFTRYLGIYWLTNISSCIQ